MWCCRCSLRHRDLMSYTSFYRLGWWLAVYQRSSCKFRLWLFLTSCHHSHIPLPELLQVWIVHRLGGLHKRWRDIRLLLRRKKWASGKNKLLIRCQLRSRYSCYVLLWTEQRNSRIDLRTRKIDRWQSSVWIWSERLLQWQVRLQIRPNLYTTD